MNATNYYVSSTRLVMQCDPYNPSSWQDLYRLLPTLRNSLSCTVCEHLLTEPYTPEETSCEHHVCKSCKGGIKKLKPTCSWCKDYSKYSENVQLRILIQNYKKLCGYVKLTPMYNVMLRQSHQQLMKDIIRESEGEKVIPMSIVNNVAVEDEDEACESETANMNEYHDSFEEYHETPEELVEEEIVGECSDSEFPGLGCRLTEELRGTDEPPDEIISSPFSSLKMGQSSIKLGSNLSCGSVRVSLVESFNDASSLFPQIKQEPIDSPEPTVKIIPVPVKSAPKRKIKGEAFILDPSKGRPDFPPQYRKLDTTPKTITVVGTSA